MARNTKPTKESLKELCAAHTELDQIIKANRQKSGSPQSLTEILETQKTDFEKRITSQLKQWLGTK